MADAFKCTELGDDLGRFRSMLADEATDRWEDSLSTNQRYLLSEVQSVLKQIVYEGCVPDSVEAKFNELANAEPLERPQEFITDLATVDIPKAFDIPLED